MNRSGLDINEWHRCREATLSQPTVLSPIFPRPVPLIISASERIIQLVYAWVMQRARTLQAQNCSTFIPPPLEPEECNSILDIFAWLRARCTTHSAFTYHDGESVRTISWGDFIQAVRAAARIVTEKVFQGDAPAPSSGGPKIVIGILAITGRSMLKLTSSHY